MRGLHNLSGGERFLVSRALALGLAEMSTVSGVKIESLFIDEGFGALEPASLGQAITLLEQRPKPDRGGGWVRTIPVVALLWQSEQLLPPNSFLLAAQRIRHENGCRYSFRQVTRPADMR